MFSVETSCKVMYFNIVLLSCQLLVKNSKAFIEQPGELSYEHVGLNSRRGGVDQCGTCLCRSIPSAQSVTIVDCEFMGGTNELVIKNIQHGRVEISEMISTRKNDKKLIVTIEDTQIELIRDLSQHLIDNIAKIVMKHNPKLLLGSSTAVLLSGTMEVHTKGFFMHDVNSFSAETWFFNGVNFAELNYRAVFDWQMFKSTRVVISGPTFRLPDFRKNQHIEKLEITNMDLLDNENPLTNSFLAETRRICNLVIRNSPEVVLPRDVLKGMNLSQEISLQLDLPNIVQSSFKTVDMVDKINGIKVINKNKWETAEDSDCRYFCGKPLVNALKDTKPPECAERKNPDTFLCALCLKNRLGEEADFETTKKICGYDSRKSPDYGYDYGYNAATEQGPDFYKSPQNMANPSYSTIVLIVFHVFHISSVHSSVASNTQ